MTAYYNEFDDAAADWLEALIADGELPTGVVDRRSIADVEAKDLEGFTQVHFFAGIGGWPLALDLAGWPRDRPVWTGSCPCPPFSAAGKGSECPSCGGKSNLAHPVVTAGWLCLSCGDEWRGDDRHLLPEFLRLIGQRRPSVVFGEQVASADGRLWFAALRAVVERVGYAAGAADLCAAGVGAPHIRQRLFFGLADCIGSGLERLGGHGDRGEEPGRLGAHSTGSVASRGDGGRLANARRGADERCSLPDQASGAPRAAEGHGVAAGRGADHGMADADGRHAGEERQQRGGQHGFESQDGGVGAGPSPTHLGWSSADWLYCRDGKWRPVESSVLGMADGLPDSLVPGCYPLAQAQEARQTRLRGYGNAIVPQLAAEFIAAFMESIR